MRAAYFLAVASILAGVPIAIMLQPEIENGDHSQFYNFTAGTIVHIVSLAVGGVFIEKTSKWVEGIQRAFHT